jgi:hypothetical protein
MMEARKILRMQAEIGKRQRRLVHVLPDDLLALLDDAGELERLAQAGPAPGPPFVNLDLNALEAQARATESETMPGTYFGTFVPGRELLELVRLLRFYSTVRCQCIHTQVAALLGPE